MKTAYCTLLFFASLHAFGQWNERLWEDGPLTWDDFRGEPFVSSPNASELNYQLAYSTTKKKLPGNTTVFAFSTRNYMNPNISWVKDSHRSEKLLRYNQALFDILELNRRRLQSTLHRIDNLYAAEETFRIQYEACMYEVKRFREETASGTDRSALDYWERRLDRELEATPTGARSGDC